MRPSRKDGVVALDLLQALQLLDTGMPHLHLGLECGACLRSEWALLLMPEQLLPGAAIVCLGVAQVWEFHETKSAMPRLAGGIGQLVHARQGLFTGLMQGVHGAGDERRGEATAVPRGVNEE